MDTSLRRRLVLVLIAGILLLAAVAVGIYGLLAGPGNPAPAAPGPSLTVPPGPAPTITATPSDDGLPGVPATANAERFAREVATALFAWDTGSGYGPLDYTAILLDVGDPTGTERNGLASDIATYLPNAEAWAGLRRYATRQELSIESVTVPAAWADALAQARPGQLLPGTIAYTIDGTRHRDGVWNGQPVASEHAVSFTVFVVCAPSFDTCHLLRLSQLDNPLR